MASLSEEPINASKTQKPYLLVTVLQRKISVVSALISRIRSVAMQEGNFNPVKGGSSRLEENRTNIKVRRRTDNDIGDWRQNPVSTVNLRPSWDFSPLKDGQYF
ncbi:unnamed protein product [Onchocerca flexuosa]|uniref:Uncharacterized protein n=1 Tax=Onchocerca flexuosa TaxID=387005 RepID=A0A183HVC5_9BILA|nr:unnamed protein product [Onchocerca flexuosa]